VFEEAEIALSEAAGPDGTIRDPLLYVLACTGLKDRAMDLLDTAAAIAKQNGSHFLLSEVVRTKAEVLAQLKGRDAKEVEALYQLHHQIGSVSDSKTLAIQRLEVGLEVQSDIVDAVALEFDRLFPLHSAVIEPGSIPNTCLEVQIVFLPDTHVGQCLRTGNVSWRSCSSSWSAEESAEVVRLDR
jgi:hypothetical protein